MDQFTILLASAFVHAHEFMSTRHSVDKLAFDSVMSDPILKKGLAKMDEMSLLPIRRDGVRYGFVSEDTDE